MPLNHAYRRMKNAFDGNNEMRQAQKQLSGLEIHELLSEYTNVTHGKQRFHKDDPFMPVQSRKRRSRNEASGSRVTETTNSLPRGWNKISIFFRLPYWKHLKIRHNLDVMHIEKNVCDNIISTLLQDRTKSKDGINARGDLLAMGIRTDLHAREIGDNRWELPASKVTMSKTEMQ